VLAVGRVAVNVVDAADSVALAACTNFGDDVGGGVVLTVHDAVAGVGSVPPDVVDVTEKECGPAARPV
jgi:hypothetical protein